MNALLCLLASLALAASVINAAPMPQVKPTSESTTTMSIDEQRQLLYVVSKRVAPDLPQPEILTFLAGDIPNDKLRALQVIAASNGTDPVPAPAPATPARRLIASTDLNRIKAAAYYATIPYCGTGDQIKNLTCGPKCQNAALTGAKVTQILEGESTFGFVAVRSNPREIYVSFRGTSTAQNEADFAQTHIAP
ncbi:hypothetical protein BCR44DRAFT_1516929 [Catenaria anguillulae PL171]|uniref:Uncharacterized protein n=1 Tax=Catenaria anguillulae PL171 TaxID=765915 RepID=A0A1Y2H7V2_9FUNG|nr:hypothetical protein BCR44DRAFT_1516929 [Catenaria anguillulae PL171]